MLFSNYLLFKRKGLYSTTLELCTFSHIIIFYSSFRTLSIQIMNIQQHIGIVFFFFRTFELYRSKSNENFCSFLFLLLSLSYFIDPNWTKTTIRQYQIAFTLRLFQPLSIPIPFSISCAFYRIEPKEREEREHQTKIGHLANVCSYRIVFSFRKRAVKK